MKQEKGITLISLTIYIIVMTIVVSTIAIISTYFYKDAHSLANRINPLAEYTKFNSFFADEVNHSNLKILDCQEHYVVFDNTTQYTYVPENKAIYRNKVKIASEVENCKFERKVKNGKEVISITIKMVDSAENEQKSTDFTLTN